MDNGLVLFLSLILISHGSDVLILVVVDNGLVLNFIDANNGFTRLNPCCSGQWSSTPSQRYECASDSWVLILVVVDNGLVLSLLMVPKQ